MNAIPLTQLKDSPTGIIPLTDVVASLPKKENYNINSWFVICHCEAGDRKLSFMYHMMDHQAMGDHIFSILSIIDETNKIHKSQEVVYTSADLEVSTEQFLVKVPTGEMRGTWDDMAVKADFGWGSVDMKLSAKGYPIYNAATGTFSLLGMQIWQCSVPEIEASGKITFQGETFDVTGQAWFDRQWEHTDLPLIGKWSWMDLNLDNGDYISLWGCVNLITEKENAWATILHPDGSHEVVEVEPLSKGEQEIWNSEESDMSYPTRWTVRIPAKDAVLDIVPLIPQQEVISELDPKYEASCRISGTYAGKPVSGHCYVELVGGWREI